MTVSCRTGRLRGGRSLRDAYTFLCWFSSLTVGVKLRVWRDEWRMQSGLRRGRELF
jgi:hypothetical protein